MKKQEFLNKIIFMSGYSHTDKVKEDKINYFVDCLKLIPYSQNYPFCSVNINARIFCNILQQLVNSNSAFKYKYISHFYINYPEICNPKTLFNKPFKADLEKLDLELKKLISLKPDDRNLIKTFDASNLRLAIEKAKDTLDKNYFASVVEHLKKVIFCKENIHIHNHIEILEQCASEIIIEFYSIGYTSEKVQEIFDEAIKGNFISMENIYPSSLYKIPVPNAIYKKQKTISLDEYKALVTKHLSKSTLRNQFDNLLYIYQQSQRLRTYVFRINNLSIEKREVLTYNHVKFSPSFMSKYTGEDTRPEFKKFFEPKSSYVFSEVTVKSGNESTALQLAIEKIQECLNFLEFNIDQVGDKRLKRPYIDYSQYVIDDITPTLYGKNNVMRIKKADVSYFNYITELQDLNSNIVINNYLAIDKIFFEASNNYNDFSKISNLWRYCEALFTEDKSAEYIMQKLVAYYVSKTEFHKFVGIHLMIRAYTHSLFYSSPEKISDMGLTIDTFHNLCNEKTFVKDFVVKWNKLIKHPLINEQKRRIGTNSAKEAKKVLTTHYYKIIKAANIQRNLFQHSNIMIDELKGVWNDKFETFVGTLRHLIIDDLKANPQIKNIEDLF